MSKPKDTGFREWTAEALTSRIKHIHTMSADHQEETLMIELEELAAFMEFELKQRMERNESK